MNLYYEGKSLGVVQSTTVDFDKLEYFDSGIIHAISKPKSINFTLICNNDEVRHIFDLRDSDKQNYSLFCEPFQIKIKVFQSTKISLEWIKETVAKVEISFDF